MRIRSTRPFVDRPLSDVAAATVLAERAAVAWELPTPTLVRTGMNAIFDAGDAVIRIGEPSAPATTSLTLAAMLGDQGIRAALPLHDDVLTAGAMSATCWERIDSSGQPIDWWTVGTMVRRVHRLDVAAVPDGYPLPLSTSFPWWNFDRLLDDVGSTLDSAARAGIDAAIARWPDWRCPDGAVVCHGDVHPGNVIMSRDGAVLIDWDLLCLAPPGWDHAPMMRWSDRWGGDPRDYDQFAIGYGRDLRGDPSADAFAELRLVAATLMRLKAGLTHGAAMPEAQRRLAFWRGDSRAPAWQAQ